MTSPDCYNLQRFIDAQEDMYETARRELEAGFKANHWMWFVFPQLAGLGRSSTAKFYAIVSVDEARAYLTHPLLGDRLRRCVEALQTWAGRRSAEEILGPVDATKLRSSLTLFDRVEPRGIFEEALVNFFDARRDELTLALLDQRQ